MVDPFATTNYQDLVLKVEEELPVDFNTLFQIHDYHKIQVHGPPGPHDSDIQQLPGAYSSSSSSSTGSTGTTVDLEEGEGLQNVDADGNATESDKSRRKRMKRRMKEYQHNYNIFGLGYENPNARLEVDSNKLPFYMNLINEINEDIAHKESEERIEETKRIAQVVEILNKNETEFVKPRRKRIKRLLENANIKAAEAGVSEGQSEVQPTTSEPITKVKATRYIDPETYPSQGAKLPECRSCHQMFQRPKEYFEHVQYVHADELPFPCSVCSKRFRTETLLKQHIRYHGKKMFSCRICGEKFLFKVTLIRHERIHSGEKPYVCIVCSKGFKQPNHLTSHQLIHNEEKNFRCITCDKAFKRRDVLVRHCRAKNHVSC